MPMCLRIPARNSPNGVELDAAGLDDRVFQQGVETPVVGAEEAVEGTLHDDGHTPAGAPGAR